MLVAAFLLTSCILGFSVKATEQILLCTSDGPQLLLETDKKVYKLGENVTIILANVGDEGVHIGGYPAWVISTYPEEEAVFPAYFAFLYWGLEPGENDTLVWDQKGYQFNGNISVFDCGLGTYVVSDTQGWGLQAFFTIGDFNQFPYYSVFEQYIRLIAGSVEQIVEIEIDGYLGIVQMAVIWIDYNEGLSDEEKIFWQDHVENQLELRWYVKSAVRDLIIVIDGEPPWPGFVIGRLLVVFIEVCDLDGDRIVTIEDITMVAVAFRTKPAQRRWNPVADLAEPYGEINIVDVCMVAKDYGKTV